MHQFGIKVSIIEPGFFKTNITNSDLISADLKKLWAGLPQETKSFYDAAYIENCEYRPMYNFLKQFRSVNLFKNLFVFVR